MNATAPTQTTECRQCGCWGDDTMGSYINDMCGYCSDNGNVALIWSDAGSALVNADEILADAMVSLFAEELDGITAETAAQAAEWQDQDDQARDEIRAESGWLRAAESSYFTPDEGGY